MRYGAAGRPCGRTGGIRLFTPRSGGLYRTDLTQGNPFLLRGYFEKYINEGLRVVLLHTYPFHREAGYLASVYPGVYFDVSMAVPLTASGAPRIIAEALELAPVSRFLFASDAHSRPKASF